MKAKTLKTKIKDLPTSGSAAGFIRQLAGVDAQMYRDAHRCLTNFKEDAGYIGAPDVKQAVIHRLRQRQIVNEFVEEFGDLTVEEFLNLKK
jgi:hypothetical protein